jgi:hypothetical protein
MSCLSNRLLTADFARHFPLRIQGFIFNDKIPITIYKDPSNDTLYSVYGWRESKNEY